VLIFAAAIAAPPLSVGAPLVTIAAAAGQTEVGTAAERIGRAFASLSEAETNPAIAAAAARASKGDLAAPACANAVWPNIAATCLATADGRPAPRVRSITIGSKAGDDTTILLRIPAAEQAQR
jgi:hypothetical protein